jgi:hypothetical protein
MPAPLPAHLKSDLARWIANDGKIAHWCRQQGVALQTAYWWTGTARFRRQVEVYRRTLAENAIGRMARRMSPAADASFGRVGGGETGRVEFVATRTFLDGMLDVGGYAELKAEVRRLEARIDALAKSRRRRA